MIGIYTITSEKHFYIGLSSNLYKRQREHFNNLSKNRHPNKHLQFIYNLGYKLGFKIIQECSINNLEQLEIFWIEAYKLLNPNKKCVNLKSGGNRPTYTFEAKCNISIGKFKKDYDLKQRYLVYREYDEELLYVGTLLESVKDCKIPIYNIINNKKAFSEVFKCEINAIEALE